MRMTAAIFASLLFLCLILAGVAHAQSPATKTKSKKPTVYDVKTLGIDDTVIGKGKVASKGKTIKVNYTGWIYDPTKPKNRGAQFDSSEKEPFTFTLGAGSVIKGWDEGFNDMKVGGKRVLTIPSEMAYGTRGAGEAILPKQGLVFEVELLDVMETPTSSPKAN